MTKQQLEAKIATAQQKAQKFMNRRILKPLQE